MWRFIKNLAGSRLGQILLVIHLCLVVYDFANNPAEGYDYPNCTKVSEWDVSGTLIANRFFHHLENESTLLVTLLILDLPALLLGMVLLVPVEKILLQSVCVETASWVSAVVLLLLTSIQWLIIGYVVERLIRWLRKPRLTGGRI